MKVLIACEYSGKVRDAFINAGHDAISCDLLEGEGQYHKDHYKGDVFDIINNTRNYESFKNIDLLIAFPPCTHLAVSGARYFETKRKDGRQQEGIDFFMKLVNAPIDRICIENPVGIMSTHYQKPTQYIQPWEYGHGETKKTGLWLKNLPKLKPTNIVNGREQRVHLLPPSADRWKLRSTTYQGIADAMAGQWGTIK